MTPVTPTATPTTPSPSGPPFVPMTAEEFAAKYAHVHAELVKGVVKEYPVPWPKHGFICLEMAWHLKSYVTQHDLGRIATNDSWIRTGYNPDTVRGGDICYFSYDRLPKGPVPEGLLPNIPDLVVEVRSPSDLWTEIFTKVGEYLKAGVRVVVVLDPDSVTASVYRPNTLQQIVRAEEELTIPDVLPGFAVAVGKLFG